MRHGLALWYERRPFKGKHFGSQCNWCNNRLQHQAGWSEHRLCVSVSVKPSQTKVRPAHMFVEEAKHCTGWSEWAWD